MLESVNVFRGRRISGIGAKVVDDTEAFTISVSVPPPPPEGKANIIAVGVPSSFTPSESFTITTRVRNDGGNDLFFIKIINADTGAVLDEYTLSLPAPSGYVWEHDWIITITQTTDFHGRIEAGHVE